MGGTVGRDVPAEAGSRKVHLGSRAKGVQRRDQPETERRGLVRGSEESQGKLLPWWAGPRQTDGWHPGETTVTQPLRTSFSSSIKRG